MLSFRICLTKAIYHHEFASRLACVMFQCLSPKDGDTWQHVYDSYSVYDCAMRNSKNEYNSVKGLFENFLLIGWVMILVQDQHQISSHHISALQHIQVTIIQ